MESGTLEPPIGTGVGSPAWKVIEALSNCSAKAS